MSTYPGLCAGLYFAILLIFSGTIACAQSVYPEEDRAIRLVLDRFYEG